MTVVALACAIAWADQLTKYLIVSRLALGAAQPVVPGCFNLTYIRNTGAVWGLFQHQNEWLILLSVCVLAVMTIGYRPLVADHPLRRVAVGCLIGGIVGNLIDRIKWGWVTDFLDVYWATHHWPSFNIADAAICVGVALYLMTSFERPARAARGA